MREVIFASRNEGKIKEVGHILKSDNIKVLSLNGIEIIPEIVESGKTFEENARIKAEAVYKTLRIPVISDDSGLSVEQLNGRPGVYSARYAGDYANDEENNRKLLSELYKFQEPHNAKFICSAAYYDGKNWIIASGEISGRIIKSPRGGNGFGYDPIFQPAGYERTTGEMESELKNKISHRAVAFKKLGNLINNLWSQYEK